MVLESVPIVAVTRCGIGVYDEQWWRSRLELLKAITFSSLNRFGHLNFTWYILLDSDVPNSVYEELQQMVQTNGANFVRFSFVENPAYMRESMFNAVRAVVAPNQRCLAMRIDDDDAIASDFFLNAIDRVQEAPDKPAVISFSDGFAFNAPDKEVGKLSYPSHPCNTVFYGTPKELDRVMFRNHTRWLEIAKSLGYRSIDSSSVEGQFLYTYHKQGDGSYENRVSKISEWCALNTDIEKRFGLDSSALSSWLVKQQELPKTVGLTWRRAQGEQWELNDLKRQMQEVKRNLIATNSSIFDPNIPFLYMLKPGHGAKVNAGTVVFTGASNPGAKVSLNVTGKTGIYRKVEEVPTNKFNGNFRLVGRFKPGKWNIRIISTIVVGDDKKEKQLDYQIVAR